MEPGKGYIDDDDDDDDGGGGGDGYGNSDDDDDNAMQHNLLPKSYHIQLPT